MLPVAAVARLPIYDLFNPYVDPENEQSQTRTRDRFCMKRSELLTCRRSG